MNYYLDKINDKIYVLKKNKNEILSTSLNNHDKITDSEKYYFDKAINKYYDINLKNNI